MTDKRDRRGLGAVAGKAIGWRTPTTWLDRVHWVIVAALTLGVLIFAVGPDLIPVAIVVVAFAGLALMLKRAPHTAALVAVGSVGALPAGVTVLFFPSWQSTAGRAMLGLWMIAAVFAPLLAAVLTFDNRPLRAALAQLPVIGGSILTAASGSPQVTGFALPVALLVAAVLLGRWHTDTTSLRGEPVDGAAGWTGLGPIIVPGTAARPEAYSDRRWLVAAWPPGTATRDALSGARKLADSINMPREHVQPVVLTAGAEVRRTETPGGVVAVVGDDTFGEFLASLPQLPPLRAAVRADIRLHLDDIDDESAIEARL